MKSLMVLLILVSMNTNAQTSGYKVEGNKITSVDRFGNKNFEHNYSVRGREIVPVDKFGNRVYNQPSTVVGDKEIYTIDKFGNRIHGE